MVRIIKIKKTISIDIVRLNSKQGIPGPGSYNPKTNLDRVGVYFMSNLE